MSKLNIVATLITKAGSEEILKDVIIAVADESRKEEGNISYVICRDAANPLKFVILEEWKSQEAIDIHSASPHFTKFKRDIAGKIDDISIDVLNEIY